MSFEAAEKVELHKEMATKRLSGNMRQRIHVSVSYGLSTMCRAGHIASFR